MKAFRDQYCRSFTVERVALQRTLERFLVLTDKSHKTVTVQIDSAAEQIHLHLERDGIGSGAESLPIQMQGDDLQLLYDVRYLWEIVRAIASSQVRFHLASATTPTLIQPDGIEDGLPLEAEYILAPLG